MNEAISPRIAPITPEELTDPAREVCAFWGEPGAWENGSATNNINVMAQHPPLGMVYNVWGKYFLMNNTLAVRQREIIVLRVAWRVRSEYEWHNHVGYGLKAGLTLHEIAALKEDPVTFAWTKLDAAVVASVDDLIDTGRVTDKVWSILAQHYSRQQLMDLVFTIGHYVMISWAITSFDVGMESPDQIGFELKTKSGKNPWPTYKPG